ncbi:hypothetical protein WICPIJ_004280 [Wickerhamomyces pijperi]|uniref:Uncharacterized protein n=1 Tax=Wickerhamomyces pijperi TaxID=599730 RepID=A0A9P8Q8E5_WICPI|nr:hypothetical protein WICPIJ_004280 [Wickerhamomyces pijperi]
MLTAFKRANCASISILDFLFLPSLGKTIPGESKIFNLPSTLTSLKEVVTPAWLPTGQALEEPLLCLEVKALMIEDLPTFGYPMTPTVMALFKLDLAAYDFKEVIKLLAVTTWDKFLLKELEFVALGEAFNGIVGKEEPRKSIHCLRTSVGIKSTLFKIKINLLPWACNTASSTLLDLVPSGSRASKT